MCEIWSYICSLIHTHDATLAISLCQGAQDCSREMESGSDLPRTWQKSLFSESRPLWALFIYRLGYTRYDIQSKPIGKTFSKTQLPIGRCIVKLRFVFRKLTVAVFQILFARSSLIFVALSDHRIDPGHDLLRFFVTVPRVPLARVVITQRYLRDCLTL